MKVNGHAEISMGR